MATLSTGKMRLLNAAIETAHSSEMTSRHGSVLAKNNKLISVGTNYNRNYLNGQRIMSCHAEIDALYRYLSTFSSDKIPKTLSKFDVWVVRIKKNGQLADSRPCWSCIKTLQSYNVGKVWYSAEGGAIVCQKLKDVNFTYITKSNQNAAINPLIRLC